MGCIESTAREVASFVAQRVGIDKPPPSYKVALLKTSQDLPQRSKASPHRAGLRRSVSQEFTTTSAPWDAYQRAPKQRIPQNSLPKATRQPVKRSGHSPVHVPQEEREELRTFSALLAKYRQTYPKDISRKAAEYLDPKITCKK